MVGTGRRRRLKPRRAAVLVLTALAVAGVGQPATPAQAAIGSLKADLEVDFWGSPGPEPRYGIEVKGVVSMTRAEAQSLLNAGHKVVWRIWGDDPVSDDLMIGQSTSRHMSATWGGLTFWEGAPPSINQTIEGYRLNEDDSITDSRDELYAGVRLVNSAGATVRSAESDREYGNWDCVSC